MGMAAIKKWNGLKNKKSKAWCGCASLLIAMLLSACTSPALSGDQTENTPPPSEPPGVSAPDKQPATDEAERLRGEYFDFAVKYRLDYVPFFTEGNAPADSTEYLYYAFAVNLENWGNDKGTMTRDYVEQVIRSHFIVGSINHRPLPWGWDYDGKKYTAVPMGINDKPLYILKSFDKTVENGRMIYTVTMDSCAPAEYPLDAEQRREIRAAVMAGDYSGLTAVRTISFRYYMDETTGEPIFLSHTLVKNGLSEENAVPATSVVRKYYNYFVEHHTLVDNRVFTVNDSTLQDDVIYFAFMNTRPAEGKPANVRTQKQVNDVLMKYFGIKPKRYSTGISGMTASGDVQMGSVIEDVIRVHRLLLKQLTDNGNGSYSAVFKLYQIQADRVPPDLDARILEGDPGMEVYYTQDVKATFTEVPEGVAYYLKFSEFTLIPREGTFAPPPQETDYSKRVSRDELKSFHGLAIGMTLDEAKKLLNLPEGAYDYHEDSYADYTLVNADGWSYTFRTLPKEKSDDKNQYLMAINIRDYLDVVLRDIKLGDAYEDVIKKFPSGQEEGQIPGSPGSYYTRDYRFASTLHNVDIFTGDVHIAMLFGRYDTLAWADVYSTDY